MPNGTFTVESPRSKQPDLKVWPREELLIIIDLIIELSILIELTGLSRIFGRFTPHRPEEPVLGKPKAQHRLFTAVREIPSLLSS